jgi:hypothetical protein
MSSIQQGTAEDPGITFEIGDSLFDILRFNKKILSLYMGKALRSRIFPWQRQEKDFMKSMDSLPIPR